METYYKEKGLTIAREYFSEELRSIMKRQNVIAETDSFKYLVELLIHNVSSQVFFNEDKNGNLKEPIPGLIYLEATSLPKEKRRGAFQKIGDVCLFMTGFFPDLLMKRPVSINYYYELGMHAYEIVSSLYLSKIAQETFRELSEKFKLFSNVFSEMSERAKLQNDSDLLSLYERWLATGNRRLQKLLMENGIVSPLKIDYSIKQ